MNKKINCLQYSSMMILVIISSFLGIGIFSIIKSSGIDSYIGLILGFIIGLFIIFIQLHIFSYEPNLTIKEKVIKLFGKNLGNLLNCIIISIFLLMGIILMFNLNNFIVTQFLSETPFSIIGLAFSILIIYNNIKGIESISRVSLILLVINTILFLISFLGLLPKVQLENFKPFLEFGFNKPLYSVIYIVLINIVPIFLLLIVPKNNIVNSKNCRKYLIFSYIFSFFISLSILIVTVGTLGIELASFYEYPEYIVLQKIELLGFLDRIENVISMQWIFSLFVNLSLIVYYISNNIKTNSKYVSLPVTFLILFLSLKLFSNNIIFNNFVYKIFPYFNLLLLIIFIMISIKILFKTKKSRFKDK